MSRSRKDGKRGGFHVKTRELWSRRCPITNMWTPDKYAKRVTHRYERRVAKTVINTELVELKLTLLDELFGDDA